MRRREFYSSRRNFGLGMKGMEIGCGGSSEACIVIFPRKSTPATPRGSEVHQIVSTPRRAYRKLMTEVAMTEVAYDGGCIIKAKVNALSPHSKFQSENSKQFLAFSKQLTRNFA